MKVIVTGATGLIGRELCRQLVADGHSVEAWTRSRATASGRLPLEVVVREWDPTSISPEQIRGADAVLHLAGESVAGGRWTDARKQELETSRIQTSEGLVDAIRRLPESDRPSVLISASAIGYYGDRRDEILAETAAPGRGFMPDLCAAWEQKILDARSLGLRTVVVRVGVVLAAEDGMLGVVLPLFRTGLGGRLGSGRQWMSWIHLEDVARVFRHALRVDTLSGPVNAVAPHPVRNQAFTEALASAVHRPALFPAPSFALRAAVGEMSDIMTASQRVEPRAAETSGFTFRYPRLEDALAQVCSRDEHQLYYEQRIDLPLDDTFAFFADPKNLERITPPFLNFAITSLPDGELEAGSLIHYRLRLHGIPLRWRTRIERWDPPHTFVDVQERGPYALWHHTHEFEADGSGTIVRDRVRYRLPAGSLGNLVAGRFVAADLAEVFRYRHAQLERLLSTKVAA